MWNLTRSRRVASAILIGLAFTGLSACSAIGVGGSGENAGVPLEVRVTNDLREAEQVSVSLHSTAGRRQSLGTVASGETRSFEVTAQQGEDARYRLMAEPEDGETVLSRDLVLQENSIVDWDLRDNAIRVYQARDQASI